MSAQHTPGPWRAKSKSKESANIGIYASTGDLIATVQRNAWAPDSSRREADAHLMAAAPAGLALARAVAAHFEGTDAPLGQQARDFIAQATGSAA